MGQSARAQQGKRCWSGRRELQWRLLLQWLK